MTDTFETTLTRIISQRSILGSLDERAVEIGVVLPLLRQVGWNTEDVSEVYPQRKLSNGNRVDYDLQIDGESRIVIEVKAWEHNLDDRNEDQLEGYCRSAKPRLAVLTSGRNWRIYLPPSQRVGLNRKRFLEIDITTRPKEAEETFRNFLARERMVDYRPTVVAAKKLLQEIQGREKLKETLTEVLNDLATDKDELAEVLMKLVERKGIQPSLENVKHVLNEPIYGSILRQVPTTTNSRKQPASFALPSSSTGKNKRTLQLKKRNGWYNLLAEICELMQSRHPGNFWQNICSMTDWFSESQDSKFSVPVGDVGIYAKGRRTSIQIKEACYEIVAKFDYPRESLEIKDSTGAIL